MIYHVSVQGNDRHPGTAEQPFRTINRAAALAVAGDTVQVHDGVYREWVDPQNGGESDICRIVYEAAPGEHPVIKGSEVVTDWVHVAGGVWKKVLPNTMFGDWNPYALAVEGDWMVYPQDYNVHLGDVYLDGVSLYEAPTLEALYRAERRESLYYYPWAVEPEKILHPEQTVYQWYAEVDEENTTIWCQFQDKDPNAALVEINVRRSCFYPRRTGLNYITVRGFEMAHAACPFTPPTADQPAMLGPHWSRGWVIEKNHLHDAKCSAISLGKEIGTGHNLHTRTLRKPGYQYQMESVFLALQGGWCKEKIGSHVVRDNVIHDCGQNGIVGHMGCAFSRIVHNHIYNIAKKQEFWGHEIGGIKLHAALDVVIEGNNIHHCSLGTWLDWQAQGSRLSKNVYHHNDRDLFIEVTHGPCLVDHNILLSPFILENNAQGTALVHNLLGGYVKRGRVLDRATPYHFPHTMQVAGYAFVYGGDDRLFNNLILADRPCPAGKFGYYGAMMDENTTAGEYMERLREIGTRDDETKYVTVPQPFYAAGNAYSGHAKPWRAERNPILADGMAATIEEQDGKWILHLSVPAAVAEAGCAPVATATLGTPRLTEEPYESPDGTPIDFLQDMLGACRSGAVIPGPFATLSAGEQCFTVWEK